MAKYIRVNSNWKLWLWGILIPAFFSMATNIYFARQLQYYVSQITRHQASLLDIVKQLMIVLLVLLILSCIDNFGLYLFSLFKNSAENELRYDFYSKILHTPLSSLQNLNHGELITQYNTDIEQSTNLISSDIFGIVYPFMVGIGYTTAMLLTDHRIGIVMAGLGIFVITANFVFIRKMRRIQSEILQAQEIYTSACSDAIRGKMSIRQYSAEHLIGKKIEHTAYWLYKKENKAIQLQALKLLTSEALANSCIYLLTPLACLMAVYGYIGVPAILFIHQLCRCFIMYTQNFAVSFLSYNEHSLSFERMNPILSLENESEKNCSCEHGPLSVDDGITFDNVRAAYGHQQILKGISFSALPGECVGIIGQSGSGKSTLVKAFMRLIDYHGNIYIGKEHCRNIPLHVLRKYIAYVPEHSEVFPAAVYENIRYGKYNATDDEINNAAERAGIEKGENGEQLSGGQKQKVSIARALLKNAPIFIFDEPTAALDAASESKILNTIEDLKREGKCIFLITHKHSSLRVADRILKMEDGKIYPVDFEVEPKGECQHS